MSILPNRYSISFDLSQQHDDTLVVINWTWSMRWEFLY